MSFYKLCAEIIASQAKSCNAILEKTMMFNAQVDGLLSVAHNESGEKVGTVERQTMWATRGFTWPVLGLCPSDRDYIQDKPSTGIKESCPISS